MHSVIWIVSFFIICVFAAAAQPADLLLSSTLLGVLYGVYSTPVAPALKMLRRMRWFMLSILILYFWFMPGEPIISGLPGWLQNVLPSSNGLREGLARLAALTVIAAAANLLLRNSTRKELIGAIHWLIPRFFGLGADRIALRMVLTVEAVEKIQPVISSSLKHIRDARNFHAIGLITATIFNATIDSAERETLIEMSIPDVVSPALYQWLYPVLLTVLLLLA